MAYIYQTKTGKWGYSVSLGLDPVTGKQVQKTKSTFKSEKEAIRAAALMEKQFEDGELKSEAKLKVSVFLPEFLIWYGHHAKESSVRARRIALERLTELWQDTQLRRITKRIYQDRLLDLSNQYSKNYLDSMHTTGRMFFKRALELELIKNDPTEGFKLPKKKSFEVDENEELEQLNYLERDELINLLQTAKTDGLKNDFLYFTMLAYTGLRIGEMMALKWPDIDLDAGTLKITKTLYTPANNTKNYKLFPPKTSSSKRTIRIDDDLVALLKKHKAEQNEQFLKNRDHYYNKQFVFAREDGYPTLRKLVEIRLIRLLNKAGISKKITLHGFRHTHTSLLIEAGVGVKEIQLRLGHSDYKTTMNIYAHMTKNMEENAAEKFSQLMRGLL
ncbi:site-specific integrase [Domibacillus iocasae]|uniref:Integrase n=1 Tax=Domibacillus iocasae TaxID=1714016 RepID=A0A1E7DQR5_9BACI|nr:site-specific integrase [Domibacillus iocasae]OES45389.1 hypothetical protein BA724_05135 [Domibacillus iocasae]